ncbi:MAG: hypothetical protein KAG94_03810 [Clostridiales bacterium]|nr:hypothetical protein [Clostridiales bacterium]
MNISIYQPKYPKNYEQTVDVIKKIIDVCNQPLEDIDLLVFPEYSNCAGMNDVQKELIHIRKYNTKLLNVLKKRAKETKTTISINMLIEENKLLYNATILISKKGIIEAIYKKTHLAYPEITDGITPGNEVLLVEVDGVKYSFATCFELYFTEFFEAVAYKKPDIILAPSYQRSERIEALMTQVNARALDSEAYVIRASYSMGSNSLTGGYSQISSPLGEMLLQAKQEEGLFSVTINPFKKRPRPLAHGLDKMNSRDIVNKFRRPTLYRSGGSHIRMSDTYSYPRVCAHRGLSHGCPENTLPAFLAAIAVGADEIEFDLRITKDKKVVICHDSTIDRTTTGSGFVNNLTLEQIRSEDAGIYLNEYWKGITVPTLEEVFIACSGLINMNIHVYDPGIDGWVIKKVSKLAKKYDCEQMIYIAGVEDVLSLSLLHAPHLRRACLAAQNRDDQLDYVEKYECQIVQFGRAVKDKTIRDAKKIGVICNMFYADDELEAQEFINRGIDTILTNIAPTIIKAIKKSK